MCFPQNGFGRDESPGQAELVLHIAQKKAVQGEDKDGTGLRRAIRDLGNALGSTVGHSSSSTVDRIIAIYVFSGGNPDLALTVARRVQSAETLNPIIAGAIAYIRGNSSEARRLLLPLDPRLMHRALGAHVALAQAVLSPRHDPAKRERLAISRLLMPGSIVDESALRLSIVSLRGSDDHVGLMKLVDEYRRMYVRSPYAAQVFQLFEEFVKSNPGVLGPGFMNRFVDYPAGLKDTSVHDELVRNAFDRSEYLLLGEFAERLLQSAVTEERRSYPRLVLAAAYLLRGNLERASHLANSVDLGQLSEGQRKLLDSVRNVIKERRAATQSVRSLTSRRPEVPKTLLDEFIGKVEASLR